MTDIEKVIYLASKVRRRWPIFIAVLIAIFCFVFVKALFSPSFYQSTTKIVYQSSAKSTGGLAALASLAGVSVGSSGEDASAYLADIVKSGDLAALVLDHSWLTSDASSDSSKKVTLEALWEIETDSTIPNWEAKKRTSLLKKLREESYIQFSQDKKTGVITLTTEFEDPRVAFDANVFLFQELNHTLVNKMNSKAKGNRQFIESRLTEVKQDLARSENVLRAYKERNRLRLDPGDVLEENRLQRDVLINQEVMIQLQKQYEMAKIEEAKDLPVLDIIDSPRMPVEKSRPKRRMMVMLGLLVGIFVGALAAIAYDLWLERKTGSKAA